MVGDIKKTLKRRQRRANNLLLKDMGVQIMGFFKTKEEKEEIQKRNESRRKAFQEQNKKNEEIRKLYRERIREERRLRENKNPEYK